MKEKLKWVCLAGLAILAVWMLVAVSSCASLQYISEVTYHPEDIGGVRCDARGRLVVLRSDEVVEPSQVAILRVHEYVHVEQMLSYGCKRFEERFRRDSLFAMQMELEAYCVSTLMQIKPGMDTTMALTGFVMYLHSKFRPLITLDSAWALTPCRRTHEPP